MPSLMTASLSGKQSRPLWSAVMSWYMWDASVVHHANDLRISLRWSEVVCSDLQYLGTASVDTHGIVYNCFKILWESAIETILKISLHLPKLWSKVKCLVFETECISITIASQRTEPSGTATRKCGLSVKRYTSSQRKIWHFCANVYHGRPCE